MDAATKHPAGMNRETPGLVAVDGAAKCLGSKPAVSPCQNNAGTEINEAIALPVIPNQQTSAAASAIAAAISTARRARGEETMFSIKVTELSPLRVRVTVTNLSSRKRKSMIFPIVDCVSDHESVSQAVSVVMSYVTEAA